MGPFLYLLLMRAMLLVRNAAGLSTGYWIVGA